MLRELLYLTFDRHSDQSVQSLAKLICAIRYWTAKIENPKDCEAGFR